MADRTAARLGSFMSGQAFTLSGASVADRVELAKPRITAMVVFTALVGFVTAADEPIRGALLAAALVGTGLVATGAAVLNQVIERDTDALMDRTRHRPLPGGRVQPAEAVAFGAAVTLAGHTLLFAACGPLPAAVAFVTWASYLFVYTPLKRLTPLATLVGAIPGALPPVIGWTARSGSLDQGAFILFAILFLWQIPHFLAIAWMYRDDYAKGGFPMLPVLDREGSFTARQAVVHSLALLLVSLLPVAAGLAGIAYLAGAFVLGVALTLFALRLLSLRTLPAARALFLASVLYLPALSSLLLAARR
jgi:protoheme IX farnesyltransferase